MKYEGILFDLDGTLVDTKAGLISAFTHTFAQFGLLIPQEQMQSYMGPPLRQTFAQYVKESEVETAVMTYRTFYANHGLKEVQLFEGVKEMLIQLHQQGVPMGVATSKEQSVAKKILEHFELDSFFCVIEGASQDTSKDNKTAVMKAALSHFSCDTKKVLMIGDREHDLIGAKNCGLDAVSVLYGYGTMEEYQEFSPVYIAKNVQELTEWLLKACCSQE